MTYGNGDGRWATTTMTGAETMTWGVATTMKAAGSPSPSASSRRHHQWAGPVVAACPVYCRGHNGSASPRKKDHVPSLVVAAPPLVRLRVPPLIHLSFASMAGCCITFCCVASTLRRASRRHFPFTRRMAPLPLPLSHRRCAVHRRRRCVAVAPSIAPVAS